MSGIFCDAIASDQLQPGLTILTCMSWKLNVTVTINKIMNADQVKIDRFDSKEFPWLWSLIVKKLDRNSNEDHRVIQSFAAVGDHCNNNNDEELRRKGR